MFRPPTHSNPNCDNPTGLVTPQFKYVNDQPEHRGDADHGLFPSSAWRTTSASITRNPAALTLTGKLGSATSAPITTAQTVLYAGTYSNALPNATVGLTVFHGSDCGIGEDFYTDPS